MWCGVVQCGVVWPQHKLRQDAKWYSKIWMINVGVAYVQAC